MPRLPSLRVPKPPRLGVTMKKPRLPKKPTQTMKRSKNPRAGQSMAENMAMNTMASQPGSFPRKGPKGVPGAPQADLVEVQNAAKSLKEVLNLADGKMTRLQQALSEIPQ